MNTRTPSAAQLRGIQAMNAGQPQAARVAFEQALAEGQLDLITHLGLACACTALGDMPAASRATDATLALDPQNLRALLMKADQLLAAGDERAAAASLQAALRVAPPAEQLPPDLRQALAQAATTRDRLAQRFEATMQQHLDGAARALPDGASPRFQRSVDLLLGRQALYLQQPRLYCFPELPHIQFFDREHFPWLAALEAAAPAIRDELLAVMQQPRAFKPYLESDPTRPLLNRSGLLDSEDWSAYYLFKQGALVEEHAAQCPRTVAALQAIPMPQIPGRSPTALFSLMRPGAHIPPHHGYVNTRLICHLPLIVPPGCRFRVGSETREWQEGRAWLFDDTIEHEAWNPSDQTRVVLLFEVWRPELTPGERHMVSALFESIGRHQGVASAWAL